MTKLKKIFCVVLCVSMMFAQGSFAFAEEGMQELQTSPEVVQETEPDTSEAAENVAEEQTETAPVISDTSDQTATEPQENSKTSSKTRAKTAVSKAANKEASVMTASAEEDAVITPDMSQEEINAAIETADEITVKAGDYKDKDLFASGKDVRILAGSGTTSFRFMTVSKGKLILENDLTVNEDKVIVQSDKSALNLTDATVEGNNKSLKVFSKNSGDNKPNAYCMSTMGEKVVLNDLQLAIKDSSNGDRGLLNINCTKFEAHNSNLQVCDNAGKNMWGSAGAPNICVGRDGVCEAREILFDHSTVNASGSVHPYGDGFQVNKTDVKCTITFDSCKVNFDNNGGNGFMANPTTNWDNTKEVKFINSDVSVCGNGQGHSGACIGFANAAIVLESTDGANHTFDVSDNYKLGIAANNLNACTSINAKGYTIKANGNGATVTTSPQPFGYGMYLTRKGSSFEDCKLIAEKNAKDGMTLGGPEKVTVTNTDVRTVMNGSNGLVLDAETEFSGATLLSSCNGATKGDDVDTTANKAFSFTESTNGSIGRIVLNEDGTTDDSSKVVALFEGESSALTKGANMNLLKEDGTVDEEATEGDLCHHVIDWDHAKIVKEPTDTEYGSLEGDCSVCGEDAECEPLVRIVYHKNTDEEVTNVPETVTDLPYSSDIPVSGTPAREGYTFTGWYLDAEATQKCDGELNVKDPTIHLYAGWEESEEIIIPEDDPTPQDKPDEEDIVIPDDDPTPQDQPIVDDDDKNPSAKESSGKESQDAKKDSSDAKTPSKNVTKTGDTRDNSVLVVLMLLSAFGIGGLEYYQRKKAH